MKQMPRLFLAFYNVKPLYLFLDLVFYDLETAPFQPVTFLLYRVLKKITGQTAPARRSLAIRSGVISSRLLKT
ncbi:hypothetical protein L596_026858 [Steinernema carpocapsae]|uniref:Uncharacterized protein n=1 Tax=Steinernema carpocapsae TaxID=34508 RepID=A0A4U5M2K7_STECR|nr:hypothetical protein L596_026858 [Steinernema carpocapsae]